MENLDAVLPSLRLHKFPEIKTHFPSPKKAAHLTCPKCKARDDFYSTHKDALFDAKYCPGNMPAEQNHTNIFGIEHTVTTNCAGLNKEHLHVICGICGFIAFFELPGGNDGEGNNSRRS